MLITTWGLWRHHQRRGGVARIVVASSVPYISQLNRRHFVKMLNALEQAAGAWTETIL